MGNEGNLEGRLRGSKEIRYTVLGQFYKNSHLFSGAQIQLTCRLLYKEVLSSSSFLIKSVIALGQPERNTCNKYSITVIRYALDSIRNKDELSWRRVSKWHALYSTANLEHL